MAYRIELSDAPKRFTNGLEKAVAPAETIKLFRERLGKLDLDILAETVRVDNGRLDIPVYFSVCGSDAKAVIGNTKQMGKGGDPPQAEASAVMELAERFSLFSFYRDESRFIKEAYGNIKDRALPFSSIAASVHDISDDLERAKELFSGLPLKWTWAYNLTSGREMLVPFDWFFMINQFNGSSAGNCREEAILQGICEVVERHVSAIVSRERWSPPVIDTASVRDPQAVELLDKFSKAGVRLCVTDFSLDTGIPTVGVLAWDPETFPEKSEIVWTAGTTPDPEKSLIRALTEVAQLAGDFNTGSNYVASGLPKFRDLSEAGFITGATETVNISDLPSLSHDNFRVEVERCTAALKNAGMDVILVDVTHPSLGVPAFYTIVPGAHFRERAAATSVGMFSAKMISETQEPARALERLGEMDNVLGDRYYVKFFLGTVNLSLGRPEEAMGFFERALELDPDAQDVPSIYSYMAVALKEQGLFRDALRVLEKAEAYDSERTDIYNLMGFCYFKSREHEKAVECFKRVVELDPSSGIDYANIASNYREMGDRDRAMHYYRIALELDPGLDFARENLLKLESRKE